MKCQKIGDTYHCTCVKGFQAIEGACKGNFQTTNFHVRR